MERTKGTVVFFSMDALGHIHPIMSIVKELQRRGYRAVILTTRPLAMADDLRAKGYEIDCVEESVQDRDNKANQSQGNDEILAKIMEPLMERFRKGLPGTYESTYKLDGAVGKHLDDMIEKHDLIEAKLKSFSPDLIVYDHVIGIPCVTTVAPKWIRVYSGFPSALYSSINDNYSAGLGLKQEEMCEKWKNFELTCKGPIREKLRRYWAEKRQKDWPLELDLTPTSPYINFYFGPEEMGLEKMTQYKPLPEVWFRLEHSIDEEHDIVDDFKIPDSLAECPGKLVYFSLGTLVTFDIYLINRLLEILSKSQNKFIISMGPRSEHIKLYPNMWGEKFVNQKAVLKKVDLFITHGGHNSIIEAFYYGVPCLVLPVFADQFDIAQRVEDCGLGIRSNPYDCTQDELLRSIDLLLKNESLKQQMKAISTRLKSIKYHAIAVDKIEKLLRIQPDH